MKADDLRLYKRRLLSLRARLRDDASQIAGAVMERTRPRASGDSSGVRIDTTDIGTDDFERESLLSLMASRDQTLDKIEEALCRIEDGSYGVCRQCEARIPKARLNVLPYVSLCVRCASRLESEWGG